MALQKQEDGIWKPISNTWRLHLGKSVIGETDHKLLVPMLTKHMLNKIPSRIERARMRLMRVDIKQMIHVAGKQMFTSDTLSRLVAR